jgi:hypothetical protein
MTRLARIAAYTTGAAITAGAWFVLGRLARRSWDAWYKPIYRDGG